MNKYLDPALIDWGDKRLWEQWGSCHEVADNEPNDFALLFGEAIGAVPKRLDDQQRMFADLYCRGCLVVTQCRLWALNERSLLAGTFGGLTEVQRAELRRSRVKGSTS